MTARRRDGRSGCGVDRFRTTLVALGAMRSPHCDQMRPDCKRLGS